MPMKSHENILVFYKKLPTYNPQMTHGHIRKSSVKRKKDTSGIYNEQKFDSLSYDSTSRYPLDVQVFASDKQKTSLHPTQKPIALMEWLVKTYSNEVDLVLDSCMGSGSTGVAALNTNRRFLGIEKDEKFFKISKERLRQTWESSDGT